MELCPSLFCLFFCLLYFFLPPFEDLGCFSGCLMSSAGIQKLFCGIYSAFKCSSDEFVGKKVFSPSYSSSILAPPTSVLLTGESHGQRSLVGYSSYSHRESDITEVTVCTHACTFYTQFVVGFLSWKDVVFVTNAFSVCIEMIMWFLSFY